MDLSKHKSITFVILLGVVSLFADITYEGARSITGPYLATLGASAAVVGFVAGFGELLGYGLRAGSGFLADRTRQYWLIVIVGYSCNLLAVPLLALTNNWWLAAMLIVLERVGKAIRTPPRDAMLSHASQKMGMGWGFGLHEALDQIGAILGPLLVAIVLYFKGGYHHAFAILLLPALIALSLLSIACRLYPRPEALEIPQNNLKSKGLQNKAFWIYLVGACFIAAGYADFPLIAYHFGKMAILSNVWIPIVYAVAMGIEGLTAPLFGRCYDKMGFSMLILVTLLTCFFAPLVFLGDFSYAVIGVILWGIGMGTHESLMKAVVATMVAHNKRASAYGIFNLGYGIFWFLGSVLMGVLYDISILWLVIFSVVIQLAAIPLLWVVKSKLT